MSRSVPSARAGVTAAITVVVNAQKIPLRVYLSNTPAMSVPFEETDIEGEFCAVGLTIKGQEYDVFYNYQGILGAKKAKHQNAHGVWVERIDKKISLGDGLFAGYCAGYYPKKTLTVIQE